MRRMLLHRRRAATARRPVPVAARARRSRPIVTVIAALALLAGCTTGEPAAPSASATATTPGAPTSSATSTPTSTSTGATVDVPVYYVIDTRTGFRLAREIRTLSAADAVRAAVEAMIAGPADPDYATTWNPATTVLGVQQTAGTLLVDLSSDARTANVGSAGAALMIQQLVYTVTAAAEQPTAPVMLTIAGSPAGELWGAVVWDSPVVRADPIDVLLLVQIDRPTEGATSTSPVTVSGDAAVFEATVVWKVLDTTGATVRSGFTMTSEGQTFAPYSFTVALDPGTYTVVVTEDDPSGGEGGTPMSDSRTLTVT
ncbi:Gmad2 immunoglobulin-like domain-containing protein [Cellulomonas sp. P24]|uniref:Gmad2 immunoglobulin-like domain-containing protein n=1 Tax=Cellulomonas sp. P24 TaxID=2885206 RepID=UPI00216B6669|nr:Gmad2 immunoglobulin-like domain-containing protein [Cellulomonas sp. P24]MCR6494330.1 GerMN domain-containing protein [Cellulomonas sp. P24]